MKGGGDSPTNKGNRVEAAETSNMADEIARWDPADVVARAKALIQASNYEKVAEARKDVDDTLARWVATVQAQSDLKSAARGSTAVVALWRQYAALEMELRQFKQATKVFERAADCPVAGSSTALWLQYADFCIQRKKFSNARKIFVRALKALPEREQATVWMRFHAFVQSHVDPKLTLATLQHQVLPEKFPASVAPAPAAPAPTPISAPVAPTTPSTPAPAVAQPTPSAPPSIPSTLQPQQPSTGKPPTAQDAGAPTVALVDPVVAFIDKTGEANVTRTPSPLAVESVGRTAAGTAKRGAVDPRAAGVKRLKQNMAVAAATPAEPTAFFQHVPQTLPSIPTCPHLLFDVVGDGEAQKQIGNELLERLSDVLGDSAVFEGVRDLRDNQRTRDREMLYRWQELVSMQMKEGSELFARHMALEMQHGFSDPRGLIALKTQHLEQRHEFANRCQMSQQQFIEICAMDRVNALKAQQISLENMKIPELTVTADPEVVSMQVECVGLRRAVDWICWLLLLLLWGWCGVLTTCACLVLGRGSCCVLLPQRAIVGLILEAEKLWREENPSPTVVPASKKVLKTPPAVKTPPRPVNLPRVVLVVGEFVGMLAAGGRETREDLEAGEPVLAQEAVPGVETVTPARPDRPLAAADARSGTRAMARRLPALISLDRKMDLVIAEMVVAS
ncbi:hypothetical protein BBJ28_00017976 [Nothophytophthora sp. Chile5]|nr:hypothetical protein BBJ28_00017976 [Nothophytophthora sp. Chile5]